MSRRWLVRGAVLLVLLGIAWLRRPAADPAAASTIAVAPNQISVSHPDIGFGDVGQLVEHYRKHGREFGGISQGEYLHRAQALRDRPATGTVREAVREDGVVTRFDTSDGGFVAFDRDLTIRTYFRPNDGAAYFDRQLKRGRSLP